MGQGRGEIFLGRFFLILTSRNVQGLAAVGEEGLGVFSSMLTENILMIYVDFHVLFYSPEPWQALPSLLSPQGLAEPS